MIIDYRILLFGMLIGNRVVMYFVRVTLCNMKAQGEMNYVASIYSDLNEGPEGNLVHET